MYKELSKISLIIIITSLTSCKKERLNGEYEVLVGNWNWTYALHWSDNCDPFPDILDTIHNTDVSETYQVEFQKKGIINYKTNGEITKSYKLKFGPTVTGFSGVSESISTYLYLDGNENDFEVCIWDGTDLVMTGFPFESNDCDTYNHSFNRE